jgi:hypothetical protein
MSYSTYTETWCKNRHVTDEEKASPQLAHMLEAMDDCEQRLDMRLVGWAQKAEIELHRMRVERMVKHG